MGRERVISELCNGMYHYHSSYVAYYHNCLASVMFFILAIQQKVKIELVTEFFLPNYPSFFFKLTQLAKSCQKNLQKC